MNSLKDHIKSLESETQFLRKEIKEKNTLISSLIPLKILESKYCEASNLQNPNSRISTWECNRKKLQGSICGKNENHRQCRN